MECGCLWSVVSTNAARYQMAPICSKRRGPKANGTTQTHCNSPITFAWPFLGTLHVWMITQMPRGSCQLSLQRTGGDHEDALASHGWAPYSIIWNPIISHCLKQWIWLRTGLCGDVIDLQYYAISSCMPETTTNNFSEQSNDQEAQLMLVCWWWWFDWSFARLVAPTNPRYMIRGQSSITKHSTIPYVRCSFLLAWNSNCVFKMRHFSDIRL